MITCWYNSVGISVTVSTKSDHLSVTFHVDFLPLREYCRVGNGQGYTCKITGTGRVRILLYPHSPTARNLEQYIVDLQHNRSWLLFQTNNINIDEDTLQKYVRQYQNGLGIDYMKLWHRIETVRASSGTRILSLQFNFRVLLLVSLFLTVVLCLLFFS